MASHAHLPLAALSIRRVRSAGDVHSPPPRPSTPAPSSPHTFPPSPPPIHLPSNDRNARILQDMGFLSSATNHPLPVSWHPPHQHHPDIPLIEPPTRPAPTNNHSNHPRPTGFLAKCLAFFGYGAGNRARKELVSLIWNIFFCVVQVIVTISLIAYSTVHKSPTMAPLTEWKACDRPLGLWNSLWLVRLCLGCIVNIWGWNIDRHAPANSTRTHDTETGTNPTPPSLAAHGPFDTPRSQAGGAVSQSRNTRAENARNTPQGRSYSRVSLLLSLLSMSWFLTAHILVYTSLTTCRFASPHLWWLTFSILCILYLMIVEILFIAVVLFILGPLAFLLWNIFLLCIGRHPMQNPHYINPEIGKLPRSIVDKIPLVLYIPTPPEGFEEGLTQDGSKIGKPLPVYNSSNPHLAQAELAKSSSSSNSRPRRLFVFLRRKPRAGKDASAKSKSASGASSSSKPKPGGEKGDDKEGDVRTWEDHWEQGEYPFVRLEENRAACAICLLDFEEPKKVSGNVGEKEKEKETKGEAHTSSSAVNDPSSSSSPSPSSPSSPIKDPSSPTIISPHSEIEEIEITVPIEPSPHPLSPDFSLNTTNDFEITLDEREDEDGITEQPILEAIGEGAQPLRLLGCGHAFHKTCIDPWLTGISGRCPTCQRPVVGPTKKGESHR